MRRADLAAAELPVLLIPVDAIDVPDDRLRSLKPGHAAAIAESIFADGQFDPITVAQLPGSDRFTLVDGLHRLKGCRTRGIRLIEARIGAADRIARRRQEILSAWARAGHDAFDKAAQVAAFAKICGEDCETNDLDASIRMIQALNWEEETASQLGIGRATLYRCLRLARFYTPRQIALLRTRGLAGEMAPLKRLTDLSAEQFSMAWHLIESGEVETIVEAIDRVTAKQVSGFTKAKAKLLKQAEKWEPADIREMIADLRRLYAAKTTDGDGE